MDLTAFSPMPPDSFISDTSQQGVHDRSFAELYDQTVARVYGLALAITGDATLAAAFLRGATTHAIAAEQGLSIAVVRATLARVTSAICGVGTAPR